jgi:DNA modification methylase
MVKVIDQTIKENYALYHGDCCDVVAGLGDESVGLSVFSPPFADLYCYTDDDRDMGNCKNYDEFFKHFEYLTEQLHRVTQPGRIVAVHCIDIPAMKERDGYIGLKDFPGDIIRLFKDCGFIYHSKTVIWKDPLTEATRTKALGLMHKQLCKDSTRCRMGLPDYLIAFRKDGENQNPVTQGDGIKEYHGSQDIGGEGIKRSHNIWRAYASPVWMDIRQTNTLNARAARDPEDKKHICPLQLDVIERIVALWSNPGDVVLTPFLGIGSEAYVAVKNGRKAIGAELKESYYNQAVKNVAKAANISGKQVGLF